MLEIIAKVTDVYRVYKTSKRRRGGLLHAVLVLFVHYYTVLH